MTLVLTSPVIQPSQRIPERYTADGDNISPPIAWSGAPPDTQSFALVCADSNAPRGRFYHWGVYNLPAGTDHVPGNFIPDPATPAVLALNDFGHVGYAGPAPPYGTGTHHYEFHLYALGIKLLHIPFPSPARELEVVAERHAIAHARLIGTFEH